MIPHNSYYGTTFKHKTHTWRWENWFFKLASIGAHNDNSNL